LGFGCGTPLGYAAAIFHLFNHTIFKSTLFFNAAAVEKQTQLSDMDSMGGLAQKMPFTGVASALAALSTAGIPPLPGFWSKLLIVIALWLAGFKVYAILAVVASVITLSYMLSLQRRVFFGNVGEHLLHIKEAGAELLIPSTILVLIMVGVGIFFPFIIGTFLLPVTRLW
jgi:multicomponent Na+:H+ antiporter subunit D